MISGAGIVVGGAASVAGTAASTFKKGLGKGLEAGLGFLTGSKNPGKKQ